MDEAALDDSTSELSHWYRSWAERFAAGLPTFAAKPAACGRSNPKIISCSKNASNWPVHRPGRRAAPGAGRAEFDARGDTPVEIPGSDAEGLAVNRYISRGPAPGWC